MICVFFFFQAEDGIRDWSVTGVQTCALPISRPGDRDRRVGDGALQPPGRGRGRGPPAPGREPRRPPRGPPARDAVRRVRRPPPLGGRRRGPRGGRRRGALAQRASRLHPAAATPPRGVQGQRPLRTPSSATRGWRTRAVQRTRVTREVPSVRLRALTARTAT